MKDEEIRHELREVDWRSVLVLHYCVKCEHTTIQQRGVAVDTGVFIPIGCYYSLEHDSQSMRCLVCGQVVERTDPTSAWEEVE